MALIIEDGTGVVDANALITNAEFMAFANSRNEDVSAYDIATIDGSIVVASTDYISVYYSFKGELLNEDQGLSIPTTLVGITSKIKQATYNAALLNLQGKLFVSSSDISSSGNVKSTMSKVGSLEKEVEYQDGAGYTSKYPTPTVDRLLKDYVTGGGVAPASSLRY